MTDLRYVVLESFVAFPKKVLQLAKEMTIGVRDQTLF